jgi:hypothetical protein
MDQVEEALRRAYARTEGAPKRLCPASVVEQELRKIGWQKTVVWAPEGLLPGNESMDGWKEFPEANLKVGLEVEWPWQRVMGDLLKFWRARRLGQIDIGIEVVRGKSMFKYVTGHVWRLYEDLFRELPIVFCALEAADLNDQRFPAVTT